MILPSYRPQRSCGQGYVFTRVCDSVHRGVSASVHAGIPPLWGQTPPGSRHPPEQTPPGSRQPPGSRHPPEQTLPWEQTPPRSTPPRSRHPPKSRLQHKVNEQLVRILLECILVTMTVILTLTQLDYNF